MASSLVLLRCTTCKAVVHKDDILQFGPDQAVMCPGCRTATHHVKMGFEDVHAEVKVESLSEQVRAMETPPEAEEDTAFRPEGTPHPQVTFAPSWDEFARDVATLTAKLQDVPCTGVLAVARGGLLPAVMVSEALGVKRFYTCRIMSYNTDRKKGVLTFSQMYPDILGYNGGAGLIIVDDLTDTGDTFNFLAKNLPMAIRACVYAKPRGKPAAQAWAREIKQNIWVKFPWEKD